MIKETELLVEKTSSLVGLMLSGMGDGQELYDGKTIQIIIIVTQLARALNQVAMAEARILENVEKQNDEILKLLASGR
ncbi:hypothetical protein FYJ36_07570 [[Clostridium] innocuum]|uniref:hypothetical protein n=1 Tax=Clostridium innocuum TaxID=1522 RepID=UPI0012B1C4F9|nr:hypothetical protein [[Clostridium] innocuum]MCR0143009.1 hypothetical protein [[Clostridium] innocuum]MCR0359635.1 hypothetical protein [[Clostridium] innocuum]MCR0541827.1 hypothetical protein [[Clostridium] innocuum]MCR0614508.1 hypothetical protein [[Clostridium] innocuum]MCR0632775.1 hypothetical protein [[Clostridium] innocuum]